MAGAQRAIAINLFGTMLALHHAIPRLRATGGRAVTFSGGGATAPLRRFDAYAASKAAVVRLTENVEGCRGQRRRAGLRRDRDPQRHAREAGPDAAGAEYYEQTQRQLDTGGFPAAEAAELVCLLLSSSEPPASAAG